MTCPAAWRYSWEWHRADRPCTLPDGHEGPHFAAGTGAGGMAWTDEDLDAYEAKAAARRARGPMPFTLLPPLHAATTIRGTVEATTDAYDDPPPTKGPA